MNRDQTALGILTAGLAGLALGFAAGIMLAPKSGRESRELVRRRVNQAVDTGRGYVDRIRSRGADDDVIVEEYIEQ